MSKKAPPPMMKALFKRPTVAPVATSELPKAPKKELAPEDPDPPWETGGYNTMPLAGYPALCVTLDQKWMGTRCCLVRADKMSAKSRAAHKALPSTEDLHPMTISDMEANFTAKRKTIAMTRIEGVKLTIRPDVGYDDPTIADEHAYVYRNATTNDVLMVNARLDPPDRLLVSGQDDQARMASMAKDYFVAPLFLHEPARRKRCNDLLLAGQYEEAAKVYNQWITD